MVGDISFNLLPYKTSYHNSSKEMNTTRTTPLTKNYTYFRNLSLSTKSTSEKIGKYNANMQKYNINYEVVVHDNEFYS